MEPRIVDVGQITLLGLGFFGDPFRISDGWSEESIDFEGLHEVCGAFPALPVVLVRSNIGTDRRVYALMAQHPNLCVETSYYTVHRGIERLCEAFGPERVLFGTGLPHRAAGPAVTALAYSLIDDGARALVAGGNLGRLLDLAADCRSMSV